VMNEHGKSDRSVVPTKPPNNVAGRPAGAEAVEGRDLAKGNTAGKTRPGHSAGNGVLSALDRVRQAAGRDKQERFTALLHHVDVDRLRAAYRAIKPKVLETFDRIADNYKKLRRLQDQRRGCQRADAHRDRGRAQSAGRPRRSSGWPLYPDGCAMRCDDTGNRKASCHPYRKLIMMSLPRFELRSRMDARSST
jgi:hypothetical protein